MRTTMMSLVMCTMATIIITDITTTTWVIITMMMVRMMVPAMIMASSRCTSIHHEACCPSLVMPTVYGGVQPYRPSDRIAILKVEPMQGAPPGRLFRPPIPV